jgi:hypothetical protein
MTMTSESISKSTRAEADRPVFSPEALAAGEAVLREIVSELDDGTRLGSHSRLVASVVRAVFRVASRSGTSHQLLDRTPSEIRLGESPDTPE